MRLIISQAPSHPNAGGRLPIEHGYDQALAVRELLIPRGFADVQSRRVSSVSAMVGWRAENIQKRVCAG